MMLKTEQFGETKRKQQKKNVKNWKTKQKKHTVMVIAKQTRSE